MLKRLTLSVVLLVPTVALALEIQPGSPYIDVKSWSKEAPAINLLTRAGVVQGIGNNRFGPSRLVNRAELLKMAIAALPSDKKPLDSEESCFPDVQKGQWFTSFVCAAKNAGVVSGTPDGFFHPDRTVQYDEALKILTLLFGYDIPSVVDTDWGEPYYQSAVARGVDLPAVIRFDSILTRASAARLVAALKAESEGELQNLRYAEAGRFDLITSASSVSSQSSSLSSSSSVDSSSSSSVSSSTSSSSSETSTLQLPVVSHFLKIGTVTDPVANITIPAQSENSYVALVQVKLFTEVRSILNLELVTADGIVLATLLRRTTQDISDYKLTFEGQVLAVDQKLLEKDTVYDLFLRATMRSIGNDGSSEELLQVRTINVSLRGETSNMTQNIPAVGGFPKHQTAFSRIASVVRVSPASEKLQSGTNLRLGSFTIKAASITGKSTLLEQVLFAFTKIGSFDINTFTLMSGTASIPCSMNESERTIACTGLAQAFGGIATDGMTISLHANVVISPTLTGASFQADLPFAGSPESLGSIYWTDESGHFRWIEGGSPVATGTRLES